MKRPLPPFLGAFVACACLLSTLFSTTAAQADEPEPVHRYEDDRRPPGAARTKLFLTGAALTGAFYAPVLGASYIWDERPGAEQMRIPVAGPWLGFSKTKLCNARPDLDNCSNFLVVAGAVLLVLDGIGQAGGVGLMLESLILPTGPKRAVRGGSETAGYFGPGYQASESRRPFTLRTGTFELTPAPTVGGESDFGLSLFGRF